MLDRQDPHLLTIRQAAQRFEISERTLHRWIASDDFPLPVQRRGRRLALSSAAIDHYLAGEVRQAS